MDNDNLITHIQTIFKPEDFEVSRDEDYILINLVENDNDSDNDNDDCLRLKFIIQSNILFVSYLNKCGNHTGTQLLNLVETLAKSLPEIYKIGLVDESEIEIGHGIEISLSTFKIITKGISWYNSLGYWSTNKEEEIAHNMKLIKTPFIEVFNTIPNSKSSTKLLSNIKRLFNDINQNLNLDEYITTLYLNSTTDNSDIGYEKKECFKQLIFYLKPVIKYSDRLEKVIKLSRGGKRTKRRKPKKIRKTRKTRKIK
jgi:hypothetical protein